MNDLLDAGFAAILLPSFRPKPSGYSLEGLMRDFIASDNCSRLAKDFLNSASPTRVRTDENELRLIAEEGSFFKKNLHSEEIKRRVPKEWSEPSFEDALRIFPLVSFRLFDSRVQSIIFLHKPIHGTVLGITNEKRRIILSAHKVESRKKGWLFCETLAFVFRSGLNSG